MEALLLSLDVLVMIAVLAWAAKNDARNLPTTGLFRFKERLSGKAEQVLDSAPHRFR